MSTPIKKQATVPVPEHVKTTLETISREKQVPMEQIKKEFRELLETDEILSSIADMSARMSAACGTMLNKYYKRGGGPGQTIFVRVVTKSRTIKTKKSKVLDITGIVMEADKEGNVVEGTDYCCIAIWGDAIPSTAGVEVDKVYQTMVGKDTKQPDWGKLFSQFDKSTTWQEVEIESMPTIEKFYNENIEPLDIEINLNQADINTSKNNCDLRRLNLMISDANKGNNKTTGEPYFIYEVWDTKGGSGNTVPLWVTESQFQGGTGSIINADVIVTKDKNNNVFLSAHFIKWISRVALYIRPKPVKSEDQKQDVAEEEPESEEAAEEEEETKSF